MVLEKFVQGILTAYPGEEIPGDVLKFNSKRSTLNSNRQGEASTSKASVAGAMNLPVPGNVIIDQPASNSGNNSNTPLVFDYQHGSNSYLSATSKRIE